MYRLCRFNAQSRTLINNVWLNTKNHPMYASYSIEKDEISYDNAIAIIVSKNDTVINMFLFCPSEINNGKIGSVAIYGQQLEGHKQAIERSMLLFGLPVEEIVYDEGKELFLDVRLSDY